MFNWKVEEMKIMNMTEEERSAFEAEVSMEDKIAIVDSMQDNKLSYIMGLAKKYQADMEDEYGCTPTEYQKKAWVRKNDHRELIYRRSASYSNYGDFFVLEGGNLFTYPNRIHSYNSLTENEFVDRIFHKQLMECKDKEMDYFYESDTNAMQFLEIDDWVYEFGLNHTDDNSFYIRVSCPEDKKDHGEIKIIKYEPNDYKTKILSEDDIKTFATMLKTLDSYYKKIEEAQKAYEEAKLSLIKTTKNWVE